MKKGKEFLGIRNIGEKMNTFMDSLVRQTNFTETENGALAHKSTLNKVYDMFALGGAYRYRTDDDCILLFKNALEENADLAVKCLFYLRDIRGGQGERRFFRVCFKWLAQEYPEIARRNLVNIAEYGRYDDLYCVVGTGIENDMFELMKTQFKADLASLALGGNESVSLLAKWLKSENASSAETKELANRTRTYFGLTHKEYRQYLSALRTRINIVEKLMSNNEWDKIEFAKIPSKAGFIYKNAFAKRDAERYAAFINDKNTKVNATTLYPYEIVRDVTSSLTWDGDVTLDEDGRKRINKFWDNLKDYLNGAECSMLGVIDTSGSMDSSYNTSIKPIDVAISLGMYAAERMTGAFANKYISFASRPQLINIEGVDFVDKVRRIYNTNLVDNTNLEAVFNLLRDTALMPGVDKNDLPKTLVIISDMEIDDGSYWRDEQTRITEMEKIRQEWTSLGLRMPKLVYWNVAARNNIILEDAHTEGGSFVSGASPVLYEAILTGKTGIQLMLDKLQSARYEQVK